MKKLIKKIVDLFRGDDRLEFDEWYLRNDGDSFVSVVYENWKLNKGN